MLSFKRKLLTHVVLGKAINHNPPETRKNLDIA